MTRCGTRACFEDIATRLARRRLGVDVDDLSPFLLQAARIESRIKQDLAKSACENSPCLRTRDTGDIVAAISAIARSAITRARVDVDDPDLDSIARTYGDLAASEGLSGWCTGCSRNHGE